jgi:hypothetical protein
MGYGAAVEWCCGDSLRRGGGNIVRRGIGVTHDGTLYVGRAIGPGVAATVTPVVKNADAMSEARSLFIRTMVRSFRPFSR